MRAFSIFLSALALANLAEATPLHYPELGQVEAELELEADPMKKADYKKFLDQMKEITDWALIGAPYKSTTKPRRVHEHWNDEEGHMEDEETRTSDLKLEALVKDGNDIKELPGVNRLTERDTSDEYRYW